MLCEEVIQSLPLLYSFLIFAGALVLSPVYLASIQHFNWQAGLNLD
jgi:hypothetical protein